MEVKAVYGKTVSFMKELPSKIIDSAIVKKIQGVWSKIHPSDRIVGGIGIALVAIGGIVGMCKLADIKAIREKHPTLRSAIRITSIVLGLLIGVGGLTVAVLTSIFISLDKALIFVSLPISTPLASAIHVTALYMIPVSKNK